MGEGRRSGGMVQIEGAISHPLRWALSAPSAPAQQVTVAAINHSEAIANEPNGGIAERRCFPGVGGDAGHAEHHLGDLPVGRAAGAAVEGPQHVTEALPALRRHAQIGGRRRRMEPAPKARDGLDPIWCISVQRDDRGQRLVRISAAEQHDMDCVGAVAMNCVEFVRAAAR